MLEWFMAKPLPAVAQEVFYKKAALKKIQKINRKITVMEFFSE